LILQAKSFPGLQRECFLLAAQRAFARDREADRLAGEPGFGERGSLSG